jgi:iron complex transport system substrate-binding protein
MFPPTRIVCLTEETVETLYLLGEQDRIVGISGYVVRPPQARREKPRVSAFTSANIDKILALMSDLVLTFSDLQAEIAADLIRRRIVHVKARQAFPEISRQIRRRDQTAFRASRWRRRSCRALPDAPAPPKLRDRVRGWDLEFESGLLQRGVSNEPCGCRGHDLEDGLGRPVR